MLICGVKVRRQGLEPRTRWLRVDSLTYQVVTNNADECYFATSVTLYRVRLCRLLSHDAGLLGLCSGAYMPASVTSSGWSSSWVWWR